MDAREQIFWGALPAVAADAVRAAIAASAANDYGEAWKHAQAAFEALAFAKPPTKLTPDALTPEQRALVELVARRSDVPIIRNYAFPGPRPMLRRWLGLEPPGPLERIVEYDANGARHRGPLWEALEADNANGALVRQCSIGERLQIHAEIQVDAYMIRKTSYLAGDPMLAIAPAPDELHGEAAAWAREFADWMLAEPREVAHAPAALIFVELVRGKIPIEPRWDWMVPTALATAAPAVFHECLEAIPFARRTAALATKLGPRPPSFDFTETLAAVIDAHPEPDLIDAQFALYKRYAERPTTASRTVLEAIAQRLPKLAPGIAKHLARKKVAKLTFEPILRPARNELSALQKKQLAWFEREGGDWEVLDLFVVRDAKGKHVYDATIHAGDDGCVFRAGTATKVATFAQGGAEARSEAVMAALEQGLADYNARRKKDR